MENSTKALICIFLASPFGIWASFLIVEPKTEWIVVIATFFLMMFTWYSGKEDQLRKMKGSSPGGKK